MQSYRTTIHIDEGNAAAVHTILKALFNLPYPTAPRYNEELNELIVLCELNHAAEVERILAPYV